MKKVNVSIDEDIHEKLKAIAKRDERWVRGVINDILREYFKAKETK